MEQPYPYTGEAQRFNRCLLQIEDIGATLDRDNQTGELLIRSPVPVPDSLKAECKYFKRSLLELIGPDHWPEHEQKQQKIG